MERDKVNNNIRITQEKERKNHIWQENPQTPNEKTSLMSADFYVTIYDFNSVVIDALALIDGCNSKFRYLRPSLLSRSNLLSANEIFIEPFAEYFQL